MASCRICNSGILRTFVRNEFTGDRIGPRGSVFPCLVEHAFKKDGKPAFDDDRHAHRDRGAGVVHSPHDGTYQRRSLETALALSIRTWCLLRVPHLFIPSH